MLDLLKDPGIADSATPDGGWQNVPIAGSAKIVNHEWRRNKKRLVVVVIRVPTTISEWCTMSKLNSTEQVFSTSLIKLNSGSAISTGGKSWIQKPAVDKNDSKTPSAFLSQCGNDSP